MKVIGLLNKKMKLENIKDIVIMDRNDYDREKRDFYIELKRRDDYIVEINEKINKTLDYLDYRKEDFDEFLLDSLYKLLRGE